MKLLRIDSSIRVEGSVSRALADTAAAAWCAAVPGAEVVRRDLGADPLAPVWPAATAASMMPPDAYGPEHRAARALAGELVDELLDADAVLLAVPVYNFGVPQQVKHWIDLVISDPRANDINVPLLPGRPAIVVLARGGGYAPGTPREGWDHATPYLERILHDVWGTDVSIAGADLTAATYNPAMAHLADAAAQQLADAHRAAESLAVAAAQRARGRASSGR